MKKPHFYLALLLAAGCSKSDTAPVTQPTSTTPVLDSAVVRLWIDDPYLHQLNTRHVAILIDGVRVGKLTNRIAEPTCTDTSRTLAITLQLGKEYAITNLDTSTGQVWGRTRAFYEADKDDCTFILHKTEQ